MAGDADVLVIMYKSAARDGGRKEAIMAAKDGTNRGGARPGAGRKPKPLAEKLQEGKKAEAISLRAY